MYITNIIYSTYIIYHIHIHHIHHIIYHIHIHHIHQCIMYDILYISYTYTSHTSHTSHTCHRHVLYCGPDIVYDILYIICHTLYTSDTSSDTSHTSYTRRRHLDAERGQRGPHIYITLYTSYIHVVDTSTHMIHYTHHTYTS